jgi:hypothetical protein
MNYMPVRGTTLGIQFAPNRSGMFDAHVLSASSPPQQVWTNGLTMGRVLGLAAMERFVARSPSARRIDPFAIREALVSTATQRLGRPATLPLHFLLYGANGVEPEHVANWQSAIELASSRSSSGAPLAPYFIEGITGSAMLRWL